MKFFYIFTVLLVFVHLPCDARPIFTQDTVGDLSASYGFLYGQEVMIAQITSDFPKMRPQILNSWLKFNDRFPDAKSDVDEVLTKNFEAWPVVKREVENEVSGLIRDSDLSIEDVQVFADELEKRADGEIPERIIKSILICNPDYIDKPVAELHDGNVQSVSTKDHHKSKGLDYELHLPLSWAVKQGRRPNIVYLASSENGRGFQNISIGVLDVGFTQDEIDQFEIELIQDPSLYAELYAGFVDGMGYVVLDQKSIVMDGLPARKFEIKAEHQAIAGNNVKMLSACCVIYYKGRICFLMASSGGVAEDQSDLNALYEKFEPLFDGIAQSFVLNSRWRR